MGRNSSYNWDHSKNMQRYLDDDNRSECSYLSLVSLASDLFIPNTSSPAQDMLDSQPPVVLKAKELYESDDADLQFTYDYGKDQNREPEVIDKNDPRYPGFVDYYNELKQNLDVNGFERRGYMNLKEEERRTDAIANENFDLKLSIYFLKEKLDSYSENKLLELRKENKGYKAQLQSSELKLKSCQREIEEANEVINELDFKLKNNKCILPHGMTKEQQEEYTFLTQETKLYQTQFNKMKSEFSNQQKELLSLKTSLDQFYATGSFPCSHDKAKPRLSKDQAQIEQVYTAEIEYLKGILKGYEKRQLEDFERASSLQKINEGLKFEIGSVYSEIDRYANLLSDSQKQLKKLEESKPFSNLNSANLEQENSFLSQKVKELKNDNNLLLNGISELEKEVSFVTVQYNTVYFDLVKFYNENKILKNQLEQVKHSKRNSLVSLSSTQTGHETRSPTSTLSVSVPNFHEFELESNSYTDLKGKNFRLENISNLPCTNCGLTLNNYAPPSNENKSFLSTDFSVDGYSTKPAPLSPQALSSLVFEIHQKDNALITEIMDKALDSLKEGKIDHVAAYSSILKDKVNALEIFLQSLAFDFQFPTFLDNQEMLQMFFRDNSMLLNKILEGKFPSGNILCSIKNKIESAKSKLSTLDIQINNKESMMAILDKELEILIATLEQEELIHDKSLNRLFSEQYTPQPEITIIQDSPLKKDTHEQERVSSNLGDNINKSSDTTVEAIISQVKDLEKISNAERDKFLEDTTEDNIGQDDTSKKSNGIDGEQDESLKNVLAERDDCLKRIVDLIDERNKLLKELEQVSCERDEAFFKHKEISDKFTEAISKKDDCLSLLDSALSERDLALKEASDAILKQEEISKEFSEAIFKRDECLSLLDDALSERDLALKKASDAILRQEGISKEVSEAISKRDECLNLFNDALSERDLALKKASDAILKQEEVLKKASDSILKQEEASREFSEAILKRDEILHYVYKQLQFCFKSTIQISGELPKDLSQAKQLFKTFVFEIKDFLSKEVQNKFEIAVSQFEDKYRIAMKSIAEKDYRIEWGNQACDDLLAKYSLLKERYYKVKAVVGQFKSTHSKDQKQLAQLRRELEECKESCYYLQDPKINPTDIIKNAAMACEARIRTAELDAQEKIEKQEKKYKLLKLKLIAHTTECKAKFKVSNSLFTRVLEVLSKSPQRSNMIEALINDLESVKMLQQEHQQLLQVNN